MPLISVNYYLSLNRFFNFPDKYNKFNFKREWMNTIIEISLLVKIFFQTVYFSQGKFFFAE